MPCGTQQISAAKPFAYVVVTAPVHLAGWSDDGATLTAPNGKTVHLGFRDYLLTHAWVASNVPTGGEFGDRGRPTQRFTANQLHCDLQTGAITVETLPPLPPAQPRVDWQAKYEKLRSAVSAALGAA